VTNGGRRPWCVARSAPFRRRPDAARSVFRVGCQSLGQAHSQAPPRCVGPASRVEAPPPPRDALLPGWPRDRPTSSGVGAVRRAADIPNIGGPGFVEQGTRVSSSGSNGRESPVRRAWYGVYHGRRSRPGHCGRDRAWLGCRAFASCRRCEGSAARCPCRRARGADAKVTQRSLGQDRRQGHVVTPRCVAEASRGRPAPTPGRTFDRALPDALRLPAGGRRLAGSLTCRFTR